MEAARAQDKIPGQELWERLSRLDLFQHFTDEERTAFLDGYNREPAMRVRPFAANELVCKKGEYELDLCFVLKGSVDLYDEVAGTGRTRVASIAAGNMYGELGALGGLPRSTDVVAGPEGVELFYLPRYCLKFLISNQQARDIVNERYKSRAVRVLAQELELFKGVSSEFIDQLIAGCEIQRYDLRGIAIMRQGEDGDGMYIVRDGFVQIVLDREDGTHRILAYRRAGEFVGEMALLGGAKRYANVADRRQMRGGEGPVRRLPGVVPELSGGGGARSRSYPTAQPAGAVDHPRSLRPAREERAARLHPGRRLARHGSGSVRQVR